MANGEWTRFKVFIYDQAYSRGRAEAVTQVIGEAQKCQPFPVNVGDKSVSLVSVECLQQAAGGKAGAGAGAPGAKMEEKK